MRSITKSQEALLSESMEINLKNIVFSICLVLLPVLTKAQHFNPFDIRDSAGIYMSSGLNATANTIPGSFGREAFLGNFLDAEIKTQALNQLNSSSNIASYQDYLSFRFSHPLQDSSWVLSVEFKNRQFTESKFSKTAFELAFFGNQSSIGEMMDFDFHYRTMMMQSIKLGLHYKSHKHIAGFSLGAVSGSYLFEAGIKNASLYTDTDYSIVQLSGEPFINWSDSSEKKDPWTGRGIIGDLYYGYENRAYQFFIILEDFGYITYPNNELNSRNDSIWEFNGTSQNIFSQEEILFSVNRDSLKEWTGLNASGKASFMLPSQLRFGWRQGIPGQQFDIALYGRYYFFSHAYPELDIIPGWRFHPTWKTSINLSHGGFGGFRAGMHIEADFNNGFGIKAGSRNLFGMWMNNLPAAAGFYISLYKL